MTPYSFILAMEALSQILSREEKEDFNFRSKVVGRGDEGKIASYLLFVEDT